MITAAPLKLAACIALRQSELRMNLVFMARLAPRLSSAD